MNNRRSAASSAGFLASKGEKFELAAQRQLTNAKLERLQKLASSIDNDAALSASAAALDKSSRLLEIRQQIDGQAIKPVNSIARYTGAITAGLDLMTVAKGANNPQLGREATAYLMLANAKEYAGRERATLNAAFAANAFDPESYRRFVGIVTGHDLYLQAFRTYATPSTSL